MLFAQVTWNLHTVITVHIMRIVLGIILVRLIYPMFFIASPAMVEVTDRLVMITLVWLVIRQRGGRLQELGFSFQQWGKNIVQGVCAGAILLSFSLFSEHFYVTLLLLSPSQHPLITQVEQAASWRDLLQPLFLAGFAAPIAEETFYRLFTFLPLKEKWGLWRGALGSAIVFALLHFNIFWLLEMIVVGMGLAILYYRTGSLLSAIVAHSFINSTKILFLFFGISLT